MDKILLELIKKTKHDISIGNISEQEVRIKIKEETGEDWDKLSKAYDNLILLSKLIKKER